MTDQIYLCMPTKRADAPFSSLHPIYEATAVAGYVSAVTKDGGPAWRVFKVPQWEEITSVEIILNTEKS